jgi:hypothetical protein
MVPFDCCSSHVMSMVAAPTLMDSGTQRWRHCTCSHQHNSMASADIPNEGHKYLQAERQAWSPMHWRSCHKLCQRVYASKPHDNAGTW